MTLPIRQHLADPARVRYQQVFPGTERQIRELRGWLADRLPDCGTRDDIITIAAELATNAIKHTASGRQGWFTVEVSWHAAAVRIAVADQGASSGPRLTGDLDPLAESGRGLQVVRGLSADAGVSGDRDGRVVWAELPWPGDVPGLAPPRGAPEPPGAVVSGTAGYYRQRRGFR